MVTTFAEVAVGFIVMLTCVLVGMYLEGWARD